MSYKVEKWVEIWPVLALLPILSEYSRTIITDSNSVNLKMLHGIPWSWCVLGEGLPVRVDRNQPSWNH